MCSRNSFSTPSAASTDSNCLSSAGPAELMPLNLSIYLSIFLLLNKNRRINLLTWPWPRFRHRRPSWVGKPRRKCWSGRGPTPARPLRGAKVQRSCALRKLRRRRRRRSCLRSFSKSCLGFGLLCREKEVWGSTFAAASARKCVRVDRRELLLLLLRKMREFTILEWRKEKEERKYDYRCRYFFSFFLPLLLTSTVLLATELN